MGGLQGSDDQRPGDRTVMEDGTAVHQPTMTPGLTQGILKREIPCFVYAEVG